LVSSFGGWSLRFGVWGLGFGIGGLGFWVWEQPSRVGRGSPWLRPCVLQMDCGVVASNERLCCYEEEEEEEEEEGCGSGGSGTQQQAAADSKKQQQAARSSSDKQAAAAASSKQQAASSKAASSSTCHNARSLEPLITEAKSSKAENWLHAAAFYKNSQMFHFFNCLYLKTSTNNCRKLEAWEPLGAVGKWTPLHHHHSSSSSSKGCRSAAAAAAADAARIRLPMMVAFKRIESSSFCTMHPPSPQQHRTRMVNWSQACTAQANRPPWQQQQAIYGGGLFAVSDFLCLKHALRRSAAALLQATQSLGT